HPDGKQLAIRTGAAGDNVQLWVAQGMQTTRSAATMNVQRPKVVTNRMSKVIPPATLLGPNNTLVDADIGISAQLPPKWSIRHAARMPPQTIGVWPNGFTGVFLVVEGSAVDARIAYEVYDTQQALEADASAAWLRDW